MRSEELERLGLNRSEAKVYLALLSLGRSGAGEITDKAQVSPSKIYWVLEKLLQKGLVSYIIESKTRIYSAASPNKLREFLEKEKADLELKARELDALMPRLARIREGAGDRQGAEIFVGFPAMKNAYHTMYDSAKEGDEHLVFLRPAQEESRQDAVLFFNRLHKRALGIGLKRRLISDDTPEARKLFGTGAYAGREKDEVRFARRSPEGINILDDHVLLMHLSENPICVLITSKQMADDYRRLFERFWEDSEAQRTGISSQTHRRSKV